MNRPATSLTGLWVAAAVTNLGDGMRLAALPLLAVSLTSSEALIAGVTAAQYLPWAVFAPFGGVIVDRSDRGRLIATTQGWRSLLMLALVGAVIADVASIWMLMGLAFLITVGEILVDPSVVATVPELVQPAELERTNGRLTTVEVVANDFVGLPAGAVAFGFAPWLPFLLDSLSYAGSVPPFRRVTARATGWSPGPLRVSFRSEMTVGISWIAAHEFLRPLTAGIAVFHLGTAGAMSLLVLVVTDLIGAPEGVFAIVLGSGAVGATASSLLVGWLNDRFSRRALVTTAALTASFTVGGVAGVEAWWQLAALWALNGASSGILISIGRAFVQRHTPPDRLGRTAVASRMITRSSFVVGAVAAGLAASFESIPVAYLLAGSFHLTGSVLIWRALGQEPGRP